ncbi:hypothetical protein IQ07DRAFT_581722 [Pyrenochaeta sp. DS3sAY3a]|nr:hypothetical protein IQ07DRAFT_581722 [Pyrenochaeta sp. DS3sAY3a]
MGVLLSLPVALLNTLLPFTKPGTPLLQDLIHTALLCGTLYFAPQIAEWHKARQAQEATDGSGTQIENPLPPPAEDDDIFEPQLDEDVPLDDRFVLQDDGAEHDDTDGPPPPLAPTPPPLAPHNQRRQPPPPRVDDFGPFDDAQPGPVNPRPDAAGPRPTQANRTIGAKKAKSLARKDQRRAYHEFHRQEAEMRRLQEAEGKEEREAALQAERGRRAQVEEEIREREREERERVKKEREREAQEEAERRERVLARVRDQVQSSGAVYLSSLAAKEGKDEVWIEQLVRASGLLAQLQKKEGQHVMITAHGWLVRIEKEVMEKAYKDAEAFGERNGGKVTMAEFGGILEKAVLARAKA